MSRKHRPDDGNLAVDDRPPGQADECDTSNTDTTDEVLALEEKPKTYEQLKAEYDQSVLDLRAAGEREDARLKVGDTVWVLVQYAKQIEVHPATAFERHPTKGWAFNVQYPGRFAMFRDVPYAGEYLIGGRWTWPGTMMQPPLVEPVKPASLLTPRTVIYLTAVKTGGATIDEAIAEGRESWVAEFDTAEQAAAHWPHTTQAKAGLIGCVTRRTINDPNGNSFRLWDSLHQMYPEPEPVASKS